MILYTGKAKNYNYKILLANYLKYTRPLERLEPCDFSAN